MPTRPLDRLLFAQGDENCVVCCKAMNALLGSMSLKEKIRVVLNQKGAFKCPNAARKKPSKLAEAPAVSKSASNQVKLVAGNLRQRGTAKPKTVNKLMSTIRSFQKGITEEQLAVLLDELQAAGFISIDGTKVAYAK